MPKISFYDSYVLLQSVVVCVSQLVNATKKSAGHKYSK